MRRCETVTTDKNAHQITFKTTAGAFFCVARGDGANKGGLLFKFGVNAPTFLEKEQAIALEEWLLNTATGFGPRKK